MQQFIELYTEHPLRFDTATSVGEGLEYLQRYQAEQQFPQLIFVDIRLPTESGFAFVEAYEQQCATQRATCAVYILSSSMRESDRSDSQRFASVKGFVHKSDLDDCLEKILAGLSR